MTRIRFACFSLFALASIAFGLPARADAVRDAVEAGNRAFADAYLKGDSAAISQLYTADAQVIPPGGPVARGRAGIAAFWQQAIDTGADMEDVKFETGEVESTGNLAYETGNVRLLAKDGTSSSARYVVVWKRIDGKWLLHRDIWNTE